MGGWVPGRLTTRETAQGHGLLSQLPPAPPLCQWADQDHPNQSHSVIRRSRVTPGLLPGCEIHYHRAGPGQSGGLACERLLAGMAGAFPALVQGWSGSKGVCAAGDKMVSTPFSV